METIFVIAGNIVKFLGGGIAIFLVAFSPLYLYGLFAYIKKIGPRSSKLALYTLIAAIILSLILTAIFAITVIVLGAWG